MIYKEYRYVNKFRAFALLTCLLYKMCKKQTVYRDPEKTKFHLNYNNAINQSFADQFKIVPPIFSWNHCLESSFVTFYKLPSLVLQ